MDENTVKLSVLKRFLAFVAGFVSLKTARLVSLGGRGLEVSLWKEFGVPSQNGWVVERGREASKRIIANFPYHYCNTLDALPRILQSVYGNGFADAVHFDFCGTLETHQVDFQKVMGQVVLNPAGAKCMAITVADQRKNQTLDHFERVAAEFVGLFGAKAAKDFFREVGSQQERIPRAVNLPEALVGFDPDNGVKREAGVAELVIGSLLSNARFPAYVPEEIARFVYLSDICGQSFRMRTYFFRFTEYSAESPWKAKLALRRALQLWQKSPLVYLDAGSTVTVVGDPEGKIIQLPKEKEKQHMNDTQRYPKLAALVAVVGGEAQREFDQLLAAADASTGASSILEQIKLLAGGGPPASPIGEAAGKKPGPKPAVSKGATESDPAKPSNLEVATNMLRAAAQGEVFLDAAKAEAVKRLKLNRNKKRTNIVGAIFARTQGKFRGDFVARSIRGSSGSAKAAILTELASLYTVITCQKVTAGELEVEATAAHGEAVLRMGKIRHRNDK